MSHQDISKVTTITHFNGYVMALFDPMVQVYKLSGDEFYLPHGGLKNIILLQFFFIIIYFLAFLPSFLPSFRPSQPLLPQPMDLGA